MIIKVKIRVVFDCSSQQRGTSINENLFSDSDLIRHLVGVLNRFSFGLAASIANIQAMFYQVKVPEKQRSLLRFLWWNEGCEFSVLDWKNPFWANLAQKIKIDTQTKLHMQNSIVVFTFSVFNHKYPFWAILVQKIKIVSLS